MMWTLQTRLLAIMAILISLAGSAWYGYSKGRQSGMLEIRTQWSADREATAAAQAAEIQKARTQEQALHDLAEKLRKEKRDEANRLAAVYRADLERLRDRPEARAGATGVPEGAAAGVGCTGAGLARFDAEFLIGYAHDAARLQLAVEQCQAQYEARKNQ